MTSAATGTVANVNDAPTGLPGITGTVAQGQELTADTSAIADADGLGAFGYQWQRGVTDDKGTAADTVGRGGGGLYRRAGHGVSWTAIGLRVSPGGAGESAIADATGCDLHG